MSPSDKLLDLIENGVYTYEGVLREMLRYMNDAEIAEFMESSYGNSGMDE